MSTSQYATLQQDEAQPALEMSSERMPKGGSRMVSRVMALMTIFGAFFIGASVLFSFLRTERLPAPLFAWHQSSDDSDLYALHYGLITNFSRESWTMSEEQCNAAFHPLWKPLYESRDQTAAKGGHTLKRQETIERDEAAPRELTCVKIVDNAVYLTDFHHSAGGSRTEAGISLLERAVVTSTEKLPNVRFCLSTQDNAVRDSFGNTKKGDENVWLIPDFNFWAWPEPGVGSYVGFRQRARKVEQDIRGWSGKRKELFWRGATWIGEERKVLTDMANRYGWGNVHNIDWAGPRPDGVHPAFYETIEGHCKYAYLASPEGLSFSGRLKYLLNCNSIVVMRTIENRVHFSHLFNGNASDPLQNIIMLPPFEGSITQSWLNTPQEIEALKADSKKAQRIAARSVEAFRDRFLSPAAVSCYWRQALRVWASTQRYSVTLDGSETPWEAFTAQDFKLHIPIS